MRHAKRKMNHRRAKVKENKKTKENKKVRAKEKIKTPAKSPHWTQAMTKVRQDGPSHGTTLTPQRGALLLPLAWIQRLVLQKLQRQRGLTRLGKKRTESPPKIESHRLFVGKERSVIDGAIYGVLNHQIRAIQFNVMTEERKLRSL